MRPISVLIVVLMGVIGALIGLPMSGRCVPDVVFAGYAGALITWVGVGSLNHINLVETKSWKWNQFWNVTIRVSTGSLIIGLILGLTGRLIFGVTSRQSNALLFGLRLGLIGGLLLGLIGGLFIGLVEGLINVLVGGFMVKVSPNQGIQLSLKNSSFAFLVTSLTVWLVLGLIFGLNYALTGDLNNRLTAGLIPGLGFRVIVGLNRGGSAVIKHYALRLILCLNGYTPLNFVKFLDHCDKLILLKKVGGGYIFIHRMLLDYFADLPTVEKSGESKRG